MSSVVELKKVVKDLQQASSSKETLEILQTLKTKYTVNEALLRESRLGLAVGKLRASNEKEISSLAKELVKKWKTEVDRAKLQNGSGTAKSSTASTPTGTSKSPPVRKASVADSVGSPPITPVTASVSGGSVNGKEQSRSAKVDGIKVSVTGDKTRDKCIELVYDALAIGSGAPSEQILKRAQSIEQTVLSDLNDNMGKEYKDKMRSLFLNLKDKNNPGLREAVVSGELAVGKLCRMSSQEMASEERKAADRAIQDQNLHKSLGAEDPQAETDAFQCSRCKQWKTRYRQAQTRSADEPMTTFVTCTNCGNRWKFS